MNTILEHIHLWTTAQTPKTSGRGNRADNQQLLGIQKLRELILELAVRGKLVPQDPNDEPASVLLKMIEAEKMQLIKEGKIKKQDVLPEVLENEEPYRIPKKWEWARLGTICSKITDGSHNPPKDAGEGIPMLSSQNVNFGKIDFTNPSRFVSEEDFEKENMRTQASPNDVLLTIVASLGRAAVVPLDAPRFTLQRSVAVIKSQVDSCFLALQLVSPTCLNYYDTYGKGTAQKGIYLGRLSLMEIALPPLSEQHRIVSKVDELMALCDQLEQQQTENNQLQQTLVETLLANLTQASNPAEQEEAWQRISAHFDTLFTTEYSIDQLKQTILQLAVMGKLAPQDPTDEPASELLKKIAKEKARLVKEGKIKKQAPLPEITDDEKPFELPEGWEWVRIGDATLFTEYGMSEMTYEGIKGIPVIKMGDIQNGAVVLEGQKMVPSNVEGLPSLFLKNGDLLYNRTNSAELVGKTGIFEGEDDKYTFASYLIRIRCSKEHGFSRYMNLSMNEPSFRKTQIEPHLKQQCGQANVNGTILKNMIVPLPPLAEQHRIVAKVDELFALCDALKERLAQAQATQNLLAGAVVERALATKPAGKLVYATNEEMDVAAEPE